MISKLEGENIPLLYLDAGGSDIVLISGLKCEKDALAGLTLPGQKASVRKIFGIDELDDDGFRPYGPMHENVSPRPRFSRRLVAVRWLNARPGKQWSMHVLERGVPEQDLLYFDGVAVFIGLWFGHLSVHWRTWRGPMQSLEKHCKEDVFQVLHPTQTTEHLGSRLSLIDGGAGTLKTPREGVEKVRDHVQAGERVLCDAPTVSARQNLVRSLQHHSLEQVRVVGRSRLSTLEESLTLGSLIAKSIAENLLAMKTLCEEFNQSIAAFVAALSTDTETEGAPLVSSPQYKNMICMQIGEFIKARENMEAIERKVRQNVVAKTTIVCGTPGVLMKANLQVTYDLGDPCGALLTDESSMPGAG